MDNKKAENNGIITEEISLIYDFINEFYSQFHKYKIKFNKFTTR